MTTPRETMFDVFSAEPWKISNAALADMILTDKAFGDGKSARELAHTRSTRSRSVVHVQPGEYTYGWLDSYDKSVPAVVGACKRKASNAEIVEFFSNAGCDSMRAALSECNLDGALYLNAVKSLTCGSLSNEADVAESLIRLFVVCGCSGDSRLAARTALEEARRVSGAGFKTQLSTEGAAPVEQAQSVCLGLCRFEGGVLKSNPYRLNTLPAGTEIGSFSMTESSINDVGSGVSRRHLRIWRDEDGTWLAQGMGSTNGSVLVRKTTGETVVIEPPRAERASNEPENPVEIAAGDRLVLAKNTEFMVMALPQL